MKTLFFAFLLILLAIAIGFIVQKDPGYVLMAYNGWTLQTSLWVALVCEVLLFLIIYFLIRLINNTLDLGLRWENWRKKRRHHKMHEKIELGIFHAIEGEWPYAEKNFTKASKLNGNKMIAYLGAAFSANQEGNFERSDEYLNEALKADPENQEIIQIARARLWVQAERWKEAEILLLELREKSPKNKLILQLLQQVYEGQGDWDRLQDLLPSLSRYKILDPATAKDLTHLTFFYNLENADVEQAAAYWHSLPKEYQTDPEFIAIYAENRIRHHQDAEVVELIEKSLKKEWHPELLHYFSEANANKREQLIQAEKWLKKHPQDPDLLLCLGKLSLHEKFENKAHDYLRSALNIRPSPEVYRQLAEAFVAMGNQQKAIKYFQMEHRSSP